MKFENTEVWGFEHALRGMRNPKESWDKSDSFYGCENGSFHVGSTHCDKCLYDVECANVNRNFIIGNNDMALAQKLIKSGTEHRKFMRQIFVSVNITAPLYWWKEFDTYKVGTVANSTSTMHKLATTPITLECFETDDMIKREDCHGFDLYLYDRTSEHFTKTIDYLEEMRKKYLKTTDIRYWKELIRWLPESWLQKRTVTMNYENLLAMCSKGQRRFHKLNEWSGIDNPELPNFISWARMLPYAKELIFIDETED